MENAYRVYAASCKPEGGIYRYNMSSGGKLELIGEILLDRPMYFIKQDCRLHVLLRNPAGMGEVSGYIACQEDADKVAPDAVMSTGGAVACHLAVCGGDVYAANYLSGSVTKINCRTVTHKQEENMAGGRQDMPHAHCVVLSPDNKYVLCTDLGLDRIFVYDRDLNLVSECKTEPRHGVRHIVFHDDGKHLYSINELGSSVSVFGYCDGRLTMLGTYSCNITTPGNTAAVVRLSPDNKYLYASHRGQDCISVFSVSEEGDRLEWQRNVACGGRGPRDFMLTPDGRFLIIANEQSGNLAVFAVTDGCHFELCERAEMKNALCVYAELL